MKKKALIIAVSLFFFCVLSVLGFYLLSQNKDLQKKIVAQIEDQFQDQVTLESFQPVLFPRVFVLVRNFTFKTGEDVLLKSPEVRIYLNPLLLLLGKVEIQEIQSDQTACSLRWRDKSAGPVRQIMLPDLLLSLKNVSPGRPVDFLVRGSFFGPAGNLNLKGVLTFHWQGKEFILDSLTGQTNFSDSELSKILPLVFAKPTVRVKEGKISWQGDIGWEEGKLRTKGSGVLKQVVYALISTPTTVSSPMDLRFDLEESWNPVTRQLQLTGLSADSPVGKLFLKGNFGGGFEVPPFDLEIKSEDLNLDRLPEFFVPFQWAVPNKVGFSGEAQVNLFFRGKKDALSINGSMDFNQALLSYSQYFNKPKEVPLKVQLDLTLERQKVLQGNIDVWLKEMTLKGSLIDFDVKRGKGEVTFLTNKFSLNGWEKVFQPIEKYPIQGWAKLLMNVKGAFAEPETLRYNGTFTLQDTQLAYHDLLVKEINASLELTNMRASSGKMDFSVKNSPFHVEYVKNIPPYESISVKCTSPEWYLLEMMPALGELGAELRDPGTKDTILQIGDFLKKFLSEKEPLKNVSLTLSWMDTLLSVQEFFFYVYDGIARIAGEMEYGKVEQHYNFGLQIEKAKLHSLSTRIYGSPMLEGDLFLLGNFQGDSLDNSQIWEHLKGQGEFKIVEGAFNSFDLLGTLAQTASFAPLASLANGATRFTDLQSKITIQDGKVVMDDVNLISGDYAATADGFFTFDGNLNYKAVLKLNSATQTLLTQAGKGAVAEIPLQIYGDFVKPKIGLEASDPSTQGLSLIPLTRPGPAPKQESSPQPSPAVPSN